MFYLYNEALHFIEKETLYTLLYEYFVKKNYFIDYFGFGHIRLKPLFKYKIVILVISIYKMTHYNLVHYASLSKT